MGTKALPDSSHTAATVSLRQAPASPAVQPPGAGARHRPSMHRFGAAHSSHPAGGAASGLVGASPWLSGLTETSDGESATSSLPTTLQSVEVAPELADPESEQAVNDRTSNPSAYVIVFMATNLRWSGRVVSMTFGERHDVGLGLGVPLG